MQNPGSITFLALFAISTVLIYLAARRGALSLVVSAAAGGVANILFFSLFSISEGVPAERALVIGPLVGLLFTGVTLAIAAYFRANEKAGAPKPEVGPGSPPAQ